MSNLSMVAFSLQYTIISTVECSSTVSEILGNFLITTKTDFFNTVTPTAFESVETGTF